MADYGGSTPHAGIPFKGNDSPATVDDDNRSAYLVIDAKLAEIDGRLTAKETVFAAHVGDGRWAITNGLGEPVTVTTDNQGAWQVMG